MNFGPFIDLYFNMHTETGSMAVLISPSVSNVVILGDSYPPDLAEPARVETAEFLHGQSPFDLASANSNGVLNKSSVDGMFRIEFLSFRN